MAEWAVSCNLKYYDVYGAFETLKILNWKQTSQKMEIGDIVYIYISAPEMEIRFKCRVNKTNLPTIEIDDSKFILSENNFEAFPRHMELELLEKYPTGTITKEDLHNHGLKGNIMRPRRLDGELLEYIRSF